MSKEYFSNIFYCYTYVVCVYWELVDVVMFLPSVLTKIFELKADYFLQEQTFE